MALLIALDSGPLGQLSHPDLNRYPELNRWFDWQCDVGTQFLIPEIADYEVRRNLILERRERALLCLDRLMNDARYLPIDTDAMRLAARYWAQSRQTGRSVGDPKELNADVILAAQASLAGAVIATDNVRHLAQFVEARPWASIKT
jgi:predicted nucleic acid-binding protein